MRCDICSIFIGENYHFKVPYTLEVNGEKHTACEECYLWLKDASVREISWHLRIAKSLENESYWRRKGVYEDNKITED